MKQTGKASPVYIRPPKTISDFSLLDLLNGIVLVEHLCGIAGPHLSPSFLTHMVHCSSSETKNE